MLRALADCGTPFYLTGGTALHRHYFDDRYSDDLDLFVNRDPAFGSLVRRAVAGLRSAGHHPDATAGLARSDHARVVITTPEASLTVDFVNDAAVRFGDFVSGTLFPRIDSLRNILSNKITALSRLEPKDVADVWTLARHLTFDWRELIEEAGEKELGFAAESVGDLIRSFPPSMFGLIRWRRTPDRERFFEDLNAIASDLIRLRKNSLCS